MLSNCGIIHDDFELRNIIINPTEEEFKNNILESSLPILIDFEYAIFTSVIDATKRNLFDSKDFLKRCPTFACQGHHTDHFWLNTLLHNSNNRINFHDIENILNFEELISFIDENLMIGLKQ